MVWPHGSETGLRSGAPGSGSSVAKLCRQTQQENSSVSSKPNMLPALTAPDQRHRKSPDGRGVLCALAGGRTAGGHLHGRARRCRTRSPSTSRLLPGPVLGTRCLGPGCTVCCRSSRTEGKVRLPGLLADQAPPLRPDYATIRADFIRTVTCDMGGVCSLRIRAAGVGARHYVTRRSRPFASHQRARRKRPLTAAGAVCSSAVSCMRRATTVRRIAKTSDFRDSQLAPIRKRPP